MMTNANMIAVANNIIQIWTYHEGNIVFYGSEATVLTEAKLRTILLQKIHKTYND